MFASFTPSEEKSSLDKYSRNLNDEIVKNTIDPTIGREEEIRRLIEILSRKNKNNPVLIGEPGVGKTAIVEGFARKIVNNDVPDNLKDVEVVELSLSSLIAGTQYQGSFESRLNNILKEVKKSNGKIILFIDEIHQLVGMGKNSSNSAMDAANILKPMMARGEIKVIGATTIDEYRKYIEKDGALERRMQKIIVNEPSKQEALTIMRGLKERWEAFHKVRIFDDALVAAVEMSSRYISDRYLPDKAIDLIDEAAAKIKTIIHSLPPEIDNLKQKVIYLSTELAALEQEKKENPEIKLGRIDQLKKEIKELTDQQDVLMNKWNEQKKIHERINKLKEEVNNINAEIERLQAKGEYTMASKLLYLEIPKRQEEIERKTKELSNFTDNLIKTSITRLEIAEVISQSTKIPLTKLVASEQQKLLNLKNDLSKYVKGQEEALQKVSDAVLRGRAQINDPNRPIGSFLFLGPTGVGKTEVAKKLAYCLFDNEKAMVRIDMSEFMEQHSVAKLIGAPAGYVGYDQPGILSEAIRTKPYAVVLFDEIEKAHPDVLNILLQILDDGQLKDNHNRMVNFKNTIIIMTSNIGAENILANNPEKAFQELKKIMRPELLNRIDEVVTFNSLKDKDILDISAKLLNDLTERIKEQQIVINFDKKVIEKVAKNGANSAFGARPLKRYIQREVENFLAKKILENKLEKNQSYICTVNPETNELVIQNTKKLVS
ncbi:ATP-dependent Clp protease ATP-binding subunit [Mycoplasma sp. E35C]|uniref:ATP-dependent Clp protease ATP-binding subunit n=1 Tax=Mycoplasma sp. E35C TaxID=2801918 RepID=UPI001CA3ACA0|nr:ATP-dependent Clp protease ATP-binding subunit [Mycoplasma sp. E35C]QZX48925.1 AAA family ATPase [Mycoplasma sp. E35C]